MTSNVDEADATAAISEFLATYFAGRTTLQAFYDREPDFDGISDSGVDRNWWQGIQAQQDRLAELCFRIANHLSITGLKGPVKKNFVEKLNTAGEVFHHSNMMINKVAFEKAAAAAREAAEQLLKTLTEELV